eukprot:768580-Hanusia_phi.AAC.7
MLPVFSSSPDFLLQARVSSPYGLLVWRGRAIPLTLTSPIVGHVPGGLKAGEAMYCNCNMHTIYDVGAFSPRLSSTASSIASLRLGSCSSLLSSLLSSLSSSVPSACRLTAPSASSSRPLPVRSEPLPFLAGLERLEARQLELASPPLTCAGPR